MSASKNRIKKCPRCPKEEAAILEHYKSPNGGLKTCQNNLVEGSVNYPVKNMWSGFPLEEKITDEGAKAACGGLLSRLQTGDQQSQDTALGLLTAALTSDKIYEARRITNQLLEESVEVYKFPDDFIELMQTAVNNKITANPSGKATAGSSKQLTIQTKAGAGNAAGSGNQVQPQRDVAQKSDLELYAPRPHHVTTDTQVINNHFQITLTPGQVLYEYEIQGLQNLSSRLTAPKKLVLIKRMIELSPPLRNHLNDIGFDNERKIISLIALNCSGVQPGQSSIVDSQIISDYDPNTAGQVRQQLSLDLVFTREFRLDGLNNFVSGTDKHYRETGAAQAMNILVARAVRDAPNDTFQAGDNAFFTPSQTHALSDKHGLEAIRGFHSGVKPGNGSVLLNVNTAFSAFYKEQLVSDYITNWKSTNFARDRSAQDHLRGLRVRIMYDAASQARLTGAWTRMKTAARRPSPAFPQALLSR